MRVLLIAISSFMCLFTNGQNNSSTNMESDKVTIEIWSDVVCPYCLLGKKKLEKAIDKLNANDQVSIIWRSFQLDPFFPKNESVPSKKNLVERKGYPAKQVDQMCDNLVEQGKNYGIVYNFDKSLTVNTFDVHRLIHWGKNTGQSNVLKEAFMVAHFTLGIDLSKKVNILNVIETIGLNKDEAEAVLDSDKYADGVNEDIQKAQDLGIRGVPFFLFNGTDAISGAQGDRIFETQLSKALKNLPAQSDTLNDGVCTPEGECK